MDSVDESAATTAKPQRFTSRVRRGLASIMEMGLGDCVEQHIRQHTGPGLSRKAKFTAAQVADLRAAMAWVQQEAAQ